MSVAREGLQAYERFISGFVETARWGDGYGIPDCAISYVSNATSLGVPRRAVRRAREFRCRCKRRPIQIRLRDTGESRFCCIHDLFCAYSHRDLVGQPILRGRPVRVPKDSTPFQMRAALFERLYAYKLAARRQHLMGVL
jgi:hypothetical protein